MLRLNCLHQILIFSIQKLTFATGSFFAESETHLLLISIRNQLELMETRKNFG